jgi:exopolysaccharide biosynthesis polyprenyl glycosylphosphotransferase
VTIAPVRAELDREVLAAPSIGRGGVAFPRLPALGLIAIGGQVAAVWLAVFGSYAAARPIGVTAFLAITVAAAIWTAALRTSLVAAQRVIGGAIPVLTGSAVGLIGTATINPWFPGLELSVRILAGMAVGVALSALAWECALRKTSAGTRRVLLVGDAELAHAIDHETRRTARSPFALIGRVEVEPTPSSAADDCFGDIDVLASVVEERRPNIVVLADESVYARAIERLLDVSRPGFRVVGLSSFFEYAFGRVPFERLTPAWFLCLFHIRQPLYARWAKRTFDVVIAVLGLLAALPLVPIIICLVKRSSGPVIYRQIRLGEAGRPFTIFKFRTMADGAERPGAPRWAAERDTRVTPTGAFLRRSHLDEVPQLVNVLRGDMSIVGPRPERPEFVARLEDVIPFWNRRLLVKPGVTGWAQVQSGYAGDCESAATKLSYDLWYIRNQALTIDLAVCVKTAWLMLQSVLPSSGRRLPPSAHEERLVAR